MIYSVELLGQIFYV